jgi:hypothetical protein
MLFSTYLGEVERIVARSRSPGSAASPWTGWNAFVAGQTKSSNFPTTASYQQVFRGGNGVDVRVEARRTGTTLAFSTFRGGPGVVVGDA